jgi:hypothetical protein
MLDLVNEMGGKDCMRGMKGEDAGMAKRGMRIRTSEYRAAYSFSVIRLGGDLIHDDVKYE